MTDNNSVEDGWSVESNLSNLLGVTEDIHNTPIEPIESEKEEKEEELSASEEESVEYEEDEEYETQVGPEQLSRVEETLEELKKSQANLHYRLRKEKEEGSLNVRERSLGVEPDVDESPEDYLEYHQRLEQARKEDGEEVLARQHEEFEEIKSTLSFSVSSAQAKYGEDFDIAIDAATEVRKKVWESLGRSPQEASEIVGMEVSGFIRDNVLQGIDPAEASYRFAMELLDSEGYEIVDEDEDEEEEEEEVLTSLPPHKILPQRSRPDASLSTLTGGSSDSTGRVITYQELQSRMSYQDRLALRTSHPDFMQSLDNTGTARVPRSLNEYL